MSGPECNLATGDIVDLDEKNCRNFVAGGIAEPCEPPKDAAIFVWPREQASPNRSAVPGGSEPTTTNTTPTSNEQSTPDPPSLDPASKAIQKHLSELLITSLEVDTNSLRRLQKGLESLAEDKRPTTVGQLLAYAESTDITALPHLGKASWKRILKAIEKFRSSEPTDDQ